MSDADLWCTPSNPTCTHEAMQLYPMGRQNQLQLIMHEPLCTCCTTSSMIMNKTSHLRSQLTQHAPRLVKDFKDAAWFANPDMVGHNNVYHVSVVSSFQMAERRLQTMINLLLQIVNKTL